MSSANRDNFTSAFLTAMPFICLFSLIPLARDFWYLNKNGKNVHPCFILNLRENTLTFSPLNMSAVAFSYMPLLCWCMFPLKPPCWEFYLWMNVGFCQVLSPHLRWSYGFYFLFCWCGVSHWLIYKYWTILAPQNKPHLIIIHEPFNAFLNAVC